MLQVFHDMEIRKGVPSKHLHQVIHTRPHRTPAAPKGGVFNSALSKVLLLSAKVGVTEDRFPVLLPAIFTFVFYILLLKMLVNILFKKPSQPPRRPELDAWKRGMLSWLYIDFVNDWVARWGRSLGTDETSMDPGNLGRLGDLDDDCDKCYEKFAALWRAEIQEVGAEKANVLRVCCRFLTRRRIAALVFWTGVYETCMYIGPPAAMALLIRTMDDIYLVRLRGGHVESMDLLHATFVAIGLFAGIPIFCGMSNTITSILAMRMSVRTVGALSCMVYRKAQRLPTSTQIEAADVEKLPMEGGAEVHKNQGTATAANPPAQAIDAVQLARSEPEKFNLSQIISNDINESIMLLPLHMSKALVTFPILCFLFIAVCAKIGATILVCIGLCLCLTILLFTMGAALADHQYAFMYWAGKRLQFLEGLFSNIQTVKACGWELVSEDRAAALREKEIAELRSFYFAVGGAWTCILQYPNLCITTCLWGYMWFNGKTEVKDIWTLLPMLFTFQSALFTLIAALPAVMNTLPSLFRVQAFLKQQEAPNGIPRSEEVPHWMKMWPEVNDSTLHVRVQGSFSWKPSVEPAVRDIDLIIPAGSSLGVIGKVASGKTSLLMAMLGELYPTSGSSIFVPNRMGFSAQTPCIIQGTLRENILFSSPFNEQPFNEERYNDCIKAACLLPDLEILPGGDKVPIGSRGITLSAGQKVRVSMARTAYMNAPFILVDDPFRALDSETGLHILDHYLFGELLKGTTRVIVTQPDAEGLKRFDQVVLLSEGRIIVQGTPDEVMKTNEYRNLLNSHQKEDFDSGKAAGKTEKVDVGLERQISDSRLIDPEVPSLREEESEGQVQWSNVAYFLDIGGYWNTFLCVFGYFGIMACQLLGKVVLQDWSTQQMMYSAGQIETMPSGFTFLGPFMHWWVASILWYWICYYHGIQFTLAISRRASRDITRVLLHAPVDRFYNKTPVGRIMNRLSTDLMNIDRFTYNDMTIIISLCWQEIVPLTYVHLLMPIYFTIASIPLYVFLVVVVRRFLNTMIPMRYLMHTAKSSTDVCLTELDMSLTILRGVQYTDKHFKDFMGKLDAQIIADVGAQTFVKRWVIQRLLLLIGFYMASVVLISIWVPGTLSFGALGLCLANMMQVCVQVEDDMEYFAKAQFQLISMNRLNEYTKLPQEKPSYVEGDNRFTSFTIWMARESLAGLRCDWDMSGGLAIWRKTDADIYPTAVLMQKMGTEEFVAPPGQTLGILDSEDDNLMQATEWHRLAEVNSVKGDIRLMADEICSAASADRKKVRLHIKSGWIADGAKVVVHDLTVGYADIPRDILTDVSFVVEPRSKVGFIGAPGCGKSTLLLCMLRIIECRGGGIFISNQNIGRIGLHTLRRAVALVPQDPVIMHASIRDNLDPFGLYDEAQLWEGLKMVSLDEDVKKLPQQLGTVLAGEEELLSFGQRHLLDLARLVVRQPSLILRDESTSALDLKTQEIIQTTMDSNFPRSTFMVAAHRVETVFGHDKVIIFENGRIAEQGPLRELAAIKGGIFAKMISDISSSAGDSGRCTPLTQFTPRFE